MDHGQILALKTAINTVGFINNFIHTGGIMSNLVMHLIAKEGAQFISADKWKGIAGGLVLVDKSKIPTFQDECCLVTMSSEDIQYGNLGR
jgi:hypothetical protein